MKKQAVNRKTGLPVTASRRALHVDFDLPKGDAYGRYVLDLVAASEGRVETAEG